MNPLLHLFPIFGPYLLLIPALAAVLTMHMKLKREIAAQANRNRRVEAMLLRLQEAAATSSPEPHATTPNEGLHPPETGFVLPRPGMNLNRRVQALRLLRRGEDLGNIASALGVPRREIELLVRIHQLTKTGNAQENPAPGLPKIQTALTGV